jgi:hypothetical protein
LQATKTASARVSRCVFCPSVLRFWLIADIGFRREFNHGTCQWLRFRFQLETWWFPTILCATV